ncbi:DUF4982 domain-containing protein [Chitinophaga horti]|uniref:DUF4982 domain-containing protein n=1 Tax=Chitinophaga horti TaxID=2920382 RepID=A0ABY6J787_9BACT|nr:sugar-binding domain-containing protein [Chitinophaga horti]UYQ95553.1 DUF4982 domain-containing protein [Chitinophaga horti]
MRYLFGLMLLLGVQVSLAQSAFDRDWRFRLGDDSLASRPDYKDAGWRKLDLPHDWSIAGDFSPTHPATTQGGALPAGIGWYRKTFRLPATDKDVRVEFDGIYRDSEVWINGHYLGKRPNGYVSFAYDITPYTKAGVNVLAVKVDNSRQPNSRWYSGSGIYRHVRLVMKPKVAFAHQSIFIRGNAAGEMYITGALHNHTAKAARITVLHKLYDASGRLVQQAAVTPLQLNAGDTGVTFAADMSVDRLHLWSIEDPYRYRVVSEIRQGSAVLDSVVTFTGIRSFYFDENRGFFLNNVSTKIKGVCLHHDLGALGAAVNIRAIERQLEILKAMGCNAIRTAHNPPAPELLELCDRMGFLVMVEAFDMWRKKKNKFDYYADFDAWHRQDLIDMVKRDRNHPSVFMWSIGNEIREQFDSSGIRLTRELVSIVKAVDSTRPVICALSEWNPEKNFIWKSGALDLVALNYHHEVYEDFHKHYPGQVFLGSEQMSAFATRGHYDMPADSSYFWPAKSPQKIVEKGNPDYTVSAYDQVSAYWGSTHEATWKLIRKHAFLSGLFVWSGFDFLGEPIPYPWPARSSYYGIVDLAGFPKDAYYMYQSEWTSKPMLHLFPHWNWQPGQVVDVWAYYNQADEVELFLNGRSLGVQRKGADDLHVAWKVPFAPGALKAVSKRNGKVVLEKTIYTAGTPARIILTPDRAKLKARVRDLSFVTATVVDAAGHLVPDADNRLQFTIEGPGSIAGTDNGYQADTVSLKNTARKCWKGMALAIVQTGDRKGVIRLKATSPGLPAASLTLTSGE